MKSHVRKTWVILSTISVDRRDQMKEVEEAIYQAHTLLQYINASMANKVYTLYMYI